MYKAYGVFENDNMIAVFSVLRDATDFINLQAHKNERGEFSIIVLE